MKVKRQGIEMFLKKQAEAIHFMLTAQWLVDTVLTV